jgi:hypothetical protein
MLKSVEVIVSEDIYSFPIIDVVEHQKNYESLPFLFGNQIMPNSFQLLVLILLG